MMKRSLSTICLSLLALGQLTACGGPAVAPPGPVTPSSAAPAANPAPASTPSDAPAAPAKSRPAKLTPQLKPLTDPGSEPDAEISNLSGVWTSGSGGRYYLRQSGEVVIWYGESSASNPAWAQAAIGRRNASGSLELMWFDLPKGSSTGQGILNAGVGPGAKFETISNSGSMGDTAWTRESAASLPALENVAIAISTAEPPAYNLSGVWECDDGGRYYITHQDGRLVWYGENDPVSTNWSNLAYGDMEGKTIGLNWADLPKGHAAGSGRLVLEATDAEHLELKSLTGSGFGGSKWTRVLPPPSDS